MEGMGFNITDLAKLLDPKEDDDESGYVTRSGGAPGDSTVVKSGKELQEIQQQKKTRKEKSAADIWDEMELADGAELDDVDDPRPEPTYTINFRQTVTSEDVFLQMGNKTPSTASCESMVVRVQLPGESRQSTVVDVQPRHLDVRASKWRLSLFLPHPVQEKRAKASWEADSSTLEVLLPTSRELDALNF